MTLADRHHRDHSETAAHLRAQVCAHFDGAIATQMSARDLAADAIVAAAEDIASAFAAGRKVLLCGNGGSAADCQHMAAEFVSRLSAERERRALPAIALTTDSSILTAQSNDNGFDSVFARQVEALGSRGDVLIAISTSGSSPNVVEAVRTGHQRGLHVIGLFGADAPLAAEVDTPVLVIGGTQQSVQECFLVIEHAICELVEEMLFGPARPAVRIAASSSIGSGA
jgi:D-sedoheptulose 7-phosphate isomerase